MTDSKQSVNDIVDRALDIDEVESEGVRRDPSNNYVSTGRNEDNIELKGLRMSSNAYKPNPNESHEKDDAEESNSLKPSTKEDPKNLPKGSNKVHPEPVEEDMRKSVFAKKSNYLTVDTDDLRDFNISD